MACISSPSISVLLNGTPLKPIKMEKSLRQEDPFPPYLFILISEILVFLIRKAERLGFIKPLQIGVHHLNLKHLQFTDDTLFFVPLDEQVIWNYFRILDVFSVMSGLNLSYKKYFLIM